MDFLSSRGHNNAPEAEPVPYGRGPLFGHFQTGGARPNPSGPESSLDGEEVGIIDLLPSAISEFPYLSSPLFALFNFRHGYAMPSECAFSRGPDF